ncbi:13758_t:CDS:2, partial [Dentiscutata heterogama]
APLAPTRKILGAAESEKRKAGTIEISEIDNELADYERRKKIQHPLDDDCNYHVCISHNYILAISLGPIINSLGAGSDSDNYLEFGAIASDTYFVSGSAPTGSALSSSASNTYFESRSGSGADTNAAPNTNQYAALDANHYFAPDTNYYAAPNANLFI